jgi:hypothetical protein
VTSQAEAGTLDAEASLDVGPFEAVESREQPLVVEVTGGLVEA